MGSDEGGESIKSKNEKRRFVRDLIEIMETLDEQTDPDGIGLVQDFSKPKTFMHFDPNPESLDHLAEQQQYNSLQYEDSLKLRASIILEAYSSQIENINVNELTYDEKDRYDRVVSLLKFLKNIKIVDAPVLLKIYNLHRCTL